jgi:hypothetical protein
MFLALDQPMPLALMRWTVATVTTLGARQLTTPEECRLLTFTRCRICHVPASQPVKHPSGHALFDRTFTKSYQPCTAFLKKRGFLHITRLSSQPWWPRQFSNYDVRKCTEPPSSAGMGMRSGAFKRHPRRRWPMLLCYPPNPLAWHGPAPVRRHEVPATYGAIRPGARSEGSRRPIAMVRRCFLGLG